MASNDRTIVGIRALVACRWCGELHDHMAIGDNEHRCKTGKYAEKPPKPGDLVHRPRGVGMVPSIESRKLLPKPPTKD